MMRKLTLCLIVLSTTLSANAQDEWGALLGISQYQGELARYNFVPEGTHGVTGLYYRKFVRPHIAIRPQFDITVLTGKDYYTSNNKEKGNLYKKRNLSFTTWVQSLNISAEYHFRKSGKRNEKKYDPYIFAGIGLFHFNPKTKIDGRNYYLRDLPTELNKPRYALTAVNIPLGIGIRKKNRYGWYWGATIQFNATFTDYIDDVSGLWADYNGVRESHGDDVALLSDRARQLDPNLPPRDNSGHPIEYYRFPFVKADGTLYRGNPSTRDSYYYMFITLGKSISKRSGGTSDGFGKGGLFRTRKRCYRF